METRKDIGDAMHIVVSELKKRNINLINFNAIELFARAGDWQTTEYADKVKSLDAWEINTEFEENLRKNLPRANIKIIDSIKELQKPEENLKKYDFIVVDNPQNCYGEDNEYCEHFDTLPNITKLIDKRAIVVFNINCHPYDYENNFNWKNRRNEFYNLKDTNDISLDFFKEFYTNFFKKRKLKTKFCFNVGRENRDNITFIHYLVFYLEKD